MIPKTPFRKQILVPLEKQLSHTGVVQGNHGDRYVLAHSEDRGSVRGCDQTSPGAIGLRVGDHQGLSKNTEGQVLQNRPVAKSYHALVMSKLFCKGAKG